MGHTTQSVEEIRGELLAGANRLARSARQLAWWRAWLLWLTVVLSVLVALLAIDFLLRREETGLRVLSLVTLLAVALLAGRKLMQPVWRFAPTPLQLARWIEALRPDLGERLSTAVQVAETNPDDPRFGSRGFRDAVLRGWQAETHKPEWKAYLDASGCWRAVGCLMLTLAALASGFVLWPAESRLALTRLLSPWSVQAWPRRDQLEFKQLPAVVALGSELQLEVIDRQGQLPDEVTLLSRRADEGEAPVTAIATKQVDDLAVGNLPPLEQAIEVRAVGGDDRHMPWQRIDVVAPPKLIEFYFKITPPEYTRRAAQQLVGHRIQVIAGSRVEFVGTFDEPLNNVALKLASPAAAADSAADAWLPRLSDDGRTVRIAAADAQAATMTESVQWQFALTTKDGLSLEQPQRWSVEVMPDAPPTVLLQPASMKRIAANASLPIVGRASDDLALVDITAWLQVEGETAVDALDSRLWSDAQGDTRELTLQSTWDLSGPLAERGVTLAEGQVISIWLEARDSLGQIGRSELERLEVQAPERVLADILDQQSDLMSQLHDLVDAQRRNTEQAARWQERLSTVDQVSQSEVDGLAGVAQMQDSIAEQLAGPRASVLEKVTQLRQLLEFNHLEEDAAARQLTALQAEIEQIADGEMRSASQQANATQALARSALAGQQSRAEVQEQAEAASQALTSALESLQTLTDQVDHNGAVQQVQREFTEVARQQSRLQADTDAMQLESLAGGAAAALAAKQQALESEQLGLAQRLDALLERARDLADSDAGSGAAADERMEAAAEAVIRGGASQLMRQATEQLASQSFAAAAETQADVSRVLADALRQLGAAPSASSPGQLQTQAEELRDVGAELSALAESQSQLAERMQQADAGSQADELRQAQADLKQAASQQAQQRSDAGDRASADGLQDATASQAAAEQAAAEQRLPQAAEAARQAARQLQQVAEQAQQRAEQLQQQVQRQQLFQLGIALQQLATAQQPVVARLQDMAQVDVGQEAAQSDPDWQAQARQAAAEQESVRQLLRDVRQQTDQLATFDWTLEQCERSMARAIAAAQRYRISPDALASASDALRKLTLANDALQRSSSETASPEEEASAADQTDAGSSAGGENAETQRAIPPLASLKLLRGLQSDINEQTRILAAEEDAPRRTQLLSELAEQQQALGKQLASLLREIEAARDRGPEDNQRGFNAPPPTN